MFLLELFFLRKSNGFAQSDIVSFSFHFVFPLLAFFFFFSLYSYFQNCIFISNLLVFVYYLFLLRNFDFHSLLNSAFLYKSTSLFSLSIYLSYQFLFLKFILIFFSLSSVLLFIVWIFFFLCIFLNVSTPFIANLSLFWSSTSLCHFILSVSF